MKRFTMRIDPLTQEAYYSVPLRGYALMNDPLLNKGSAFPIEERAEFRLHGLVSEKVGTLEEQVERNYGLFKMKSTDLERYVTLMGLLDRTETVFYALLMQHLEEMLPIVYTPTVGEACQKLSRIIRRYRGLYITPSNVNFMERMLENVGLPNISLMVVTDGERILGFGDLGADGMGIPIGKIALYVAAAGVHPASTLPVCLDVGTDNEALLSDPLYVGYPKPRIRGDAYYDLVERFVQGVRRVFPRALIQWEDFGKQNAFVLLDRYHDRVPSFNDDIQGTGATAAAAFRTAKEIRGGDPRSERIAIVGFGQAGSGVANALVTYMCEAEGVSLAEARSRIFALDMPGLLMDGMPVAPYQRNFLHTNRTIRSWPVPKDRPPNLEEVVKYGKITTLIGLSAQPNLFDERLLRQMAANTERPAVFALSNPTSKCETTPELALPATDWRALIATGSPFDPVAGPGGRRFKVSQCNNLYIFPGMGLGAIVCQSSRVTHRMFHAAAGAVSRMVTPAQRLEGLLLPPLEEVRKVSFEVALAVAKQARDDGHGIIASDERLAQLIKSAMWLPRYYPYRFAGREVD